MRARVTLAAVLAAGVVLLAACSGTDSMSSDVVAPADAGVMGGAEMAPDMMAAPEARAADGSVTTTTTGSTAVQRQVVRSGSLSMHADDVASTVTAIRRLTKGAGGFVSAENTSATADSAYSSITVQVPASRLDGLVEAISALGTVDTVDVSAQDVTSQAVDLDARIRALQASVDRVTALLAEASDISDLMAIEAQLSSRQAELDALKAQRTWLADQVAMSTLTVSIQPVTTVEPVDAPGFGSGLESGWNALVSAIAVGVTAVGFFLPFVVVLLVIAVPLAVLCVWIVRRHRRLTVARAASLQDTGDPGPDQPYVQDVTASAVTDTVNRSGR